MARLACRAGKVTSRNRVVLVALTLLGLVVSGLLSTVRPSVAQAQASAPQTAGAARSAAAVRAGTNLLLNPTATVGDTSAQGWDAVTIPGWQVQAGLPTVVRYGTSGFPKVPGAWPASSG